MPYHGTPVHSVHFYNESAGLVSLLCGVVSSSLKRGDSVLIVPTREHRIQLVRELRNSGVDLRSPARAGRYTMIDAEELLATFMRGDVPDRYLFRRSVGGFVHEALEAARSNPKRLTAFGEMVAVLWSQGKKAAALRLESLWNELLCDREVFLLCAYPRSGVMSESDETAVCNTHSHLLQQVA